MKKKIFIAVLVVIMVVGGLAGVKMLQIRKLMQAGKSFAPPPESVASFVVRSEKWQGTLNAIATVTAAQGVYVMPEVPGTVREIAFESGAMVAKDALLVRLDTSVEQAQLSAVQAQVKLAEINLERARKLRSENMIAQSELDTADATLKQLQGNADTITATIEKKTIRAPFAGRVGIRLVNLGQYIDTGKPIVSLQALSPIYADFSLPQQDLARLKVGMAVRLRTDAFPNKDFEGKLTAINPNLDESTRSVGLQATFANEEQMLAPGMFARAEVLLPDESEHLVIPATSVLSAPYGDSVYIIDSKTSTNGTPSLVVRQQFIKTGRTKGDFLTVENGLKAGEKIVSGGVFKLRNGVSVVEKNDLAPEPNLTPHPADS